MDNPNKINKLLLIILSIVVVATLVLVSVYLYNKAHISQGTPNPNTVSQNNVSIIPYIVALETATVGKEYKTAIEIGVYDRNVQINAKVISGLPPGLLLTSCSTEYDSLEIAKMRAKNSLAKCTIEGVPQESGNFTVRVAFSIEGGISNAFKDLPLMVNP